MDQQSKIGREVEEMKRRSEDISGMQHIPLVRFCKITGYSLWRLRAILNGDDSELRRRFVKFGAVVRVGGRWYVRPQRLAEWDNLQTMAWVDGQVN